MRESNDTAKGHPRGLYLLFATEMWERFSYYGMRALLVLYLIKDLGWHPSDSAAAYKWYTSLVYLTPLAGGFLADRVLGLRAAIIIGGVLMTIGHFLMASPSLPTFFAALGFLIVGNGFFKPNISTLVGRMYKDKDPRCDGGFTVFYMGINAGAAMASIVAGWLRQHYGFHVGFAAAGVGMVIGLAIFLLGQRQIRADVEAAGHTMGVSRKRRANVAQDDPAPLEQAAAAESRASGAHVTGDDAAPMDHAAAAEASNHAPGALARAARWLSVAYPWLMVIGGVVVPLYEALAVVQGRAKPLEVLMPSAFALVAVGIGLLLRKLSGAARDKSVVIFVLFVFSVLFWMGSEQSGNALNFWADMHTDLRVAGYEYPAEFWQFANPGLILVFAPVLALVWVWLWRRRIEPSTPYKMLIALIFMALSFATMVAGAQAEQQTLTRAPLSALPRNANLAALDGGRLRFDAAAGALEARGVVAPFVVIEALEQVAGPAQAEPLPAQDADRARHKAQRLRAQSPPAFVAALDTLASSSQQARVSGVWLFLSYLFATLGELCLSPVGLSMVTKLAPTRFASLFMGVWMLSSSVAQYVGGSLGERWGRIAPVDYFATFVWTSCIGVAALLLLAPLLRRLMRDAVD